MFSPSFIELLKDSALEVSFLISSWISWEIFMWW